MLDLAIIRAIFVLVLAISAYALHPFGLAPAVAGGGGFVIGCGIIFFEIRLEKVSLKRLIGAAFGSVLGILGAFLVSLIVSKASPEPFLQVCLLLFMGYVGLIVGATKGDMLNLAALGGLFGGGKNVEEVVQDPGYQRDYRWPHRRYRRNGIPRWRPGHPAVRFARIATGGGFRRFDEAQSRPPRPRYSAAHPEDGPPQRCRLSKRISHRCARWI